ncbi:hypothetical protein K440DRAFT_660361 [Wilcoxina mikolae CBS 423.85]|nr:hypothetical protein K440DRAFT_660361 [Wilcoxina mikolae CBS 423.85]
MAVPPTPEFSGLQVRADIAQQYDKPETTYYPPTPALQYEKPPATCCGLRKRTFWIIAAITTAIILGIIGGVTGGVLSHRKSSSSSSATTSAPASTTTPSIPPNSPLLNTSLAVSSRTDNSPASSGTYLLIYQTHSNALFFTHILTDGTRTPPSPLGSAFPAKPNTPLAAISSTSSLGATLEVRLYYISQDLYLSDAIFTSGVWTPGTLRLSNLQPSPSSRLATTIWRNHNGQSITQWIYYQDPSGYIQEYALVSGKWGKQDYGSTIDLRARLGSGLATCYDMDEKRSQRLRVYAQVPDGSVFYPVYQAKGEVGDIAAMALWNANMTVQTVRLFFVEAGVLDEVRWTVDGGWAKVPEYVVEGSRGQVGAGDGGEGGTVYYQESNGTDVREALLNSDSMWTVSGSRIT